MHVKYLVYKQPKVEKYVLAIDHTKNRSLKKQLKSICEGIGVPNLKSKVMERENWAIENQDLFNLDLWMKPSKIFTAKDPNAAEEPEEDNEENDDPDQPKVKRLRLKFDWWCKAGISKNMGLLCKEFNEHRQLKPNKIIVTGPPVSGVSYFAEKLSQFYNIPLIRIKDVVEMIAKMDGELGDEIRAHLEEQKGLLVEEGRAALEKKRSQGVKGLPEDVDESTVRAEII